MNAKEERKKERLKSSSQSWSILFLSLSLRESLLSLCFVFQIVWSSGKQTKQSNQTYNTHQQHSLSLSLSLSLSHEFLPSSLPSSSRLSVPTTFILFFSLFYYVLFYRLSLLSWFCLSVRERDYGNTLTHFGLVPHCKEFSAGVFFYCETTTDVIFILF